MGAILLWTIHTMPISLSLTIVLTGKYTKYVMHGQTYSHAIQHQQPLAGNKSH